MKVTIFEKTYHGFEDFADYWRDMEEASNEDFTPAWKQIPGEFQGRVKVIITYEDDEESQG